MRYARATPVINTIVGGLILAVVLIVCIAVLMWLAIEWSADDSFPL